MQYEFVRDITAEGRDGKNVEFKAGDRIDVVAVPVGTLKSLKRGKHIIEVEPKPTEETKPAPQKKK